ncbi:hypothetical protein HNR70_000052 [Brachybacterium aquaticum]|uniref:Uncharacterized protein n=1 Tax=Brachybacterium aquaticum TaxID=1432564 RepID=A0A841A534_9MICO|nr:hypothetical protein [Brachybacterium aquaticum]
MFSAPPATTMSDSPIISSAAARAMACMPEPHRRFTVMAVEVTAAPAVIATRREM